MKIKYPIITAAVLVAAVIIVIIYNNIPVKGCLVIYDSNSGEIIYSRKVNDGERFSIEFTHSVNKSLVKDIYEFRNGHDIVNVECIYYGFGAGVQSELNAGETLTTGDDGSMIISDINKNVNNMAYIVGTLYDHVLEIGNERISLTNLCGKNRHIRFQYK